MAAIEDIEAFIVEEFEWFHRHPELSYEEVETTKRIRASLERAGIRILDLPLKTGLVAEVGQGGAARCAAHRYRCPADRGADGSVVPLGA